MKSIEEYAIDLIVDGITGYAENDLNEGEEIHDDDHDAAVNLALTIAELIHAYPELVLRLIADGGAQS